MIHFETIWNEAESVSKSYTDLKRKDILKEIRQALENLVDSEEEVDYHTALGDMLYGLCAFCAHLETKKELQINSATALSAAIARKREALLDPNKPDA